MPVVLDQAILAQLQRLDANDAKRALMFLSKLQADPSHPSLSLERVTKAKSPDVWSARITRSLRAILHRDGRFDTVVYVGQHDEAYSWTENRRIERNATTGAFQIFESAKLIEPIDEPVIKGRQVRAEAGIFDAHANDYLLSLGVPETWLPSIRKIDCVDVLLEIAERLPDDVAQRLLDLADGHVVTPPLPIPLDRPVTDSPDAGQRFYLFEEGVDFQRLLAAPLATWIAFIHPTQRKLATGSFNGPVKVTGSAGTGKTIVALHRARHLAAQGKRVLLTTYVTTLTDNLARGLKLLCSKDELSRVTVANVHQTALDIARRSRPRMQPLTGQDTEKLVDKYVKLAGIPFDTEFVKAEWDFVIRPRGIRTWDDYLTVSRSGRGSALSAQQRKQVWSVVDRVQQSMDETNRFDYPGICMLARDAVLAYPSVREYDSVVVDEIQDLGAQELRFLAALAGDGPDSMLLVGDGGQRIYARRFSLKSLGIPVAGRSHTLRINYRTTAQIRRFADRVAGAASDDLDGGDESRRGTRSILAGPDPVLRSCATDAEQIAFICEEIRKACDAGVHTGEIAIFSPRTTRVEAIAAGLSAAGIDACLLKDTPVAASAVNVGTMHRAKGLEFKVVFVADASDAFLPSPRALRIKDDQLREDALDRERNLLYVSITRARDRAFVSWVGEPSRFLASAIDAETRPAGRTSR